MLRKKTASHEANRIRRRNEPPFLSLGFFLVIVLELSLVLRDLSSSV